MTEVGQRAPGPVWTHSPHCPGKTAADQTLRAGPHGARPSEQAAEMTGRNQLTEEE